MTRRRWIADTWDSTTAKLHGDQAQHLSRVLRAQPGMEFDVVAGGRAWLARIASIDRDSVQFTLLQELEAAAALPITLLLSVFKFDRMEWAIEKAVELGASRIVPLLAERTEKHLAQAAARRVERWRRIALEAAKQSRRSDLAEIGEPLRLAAILAPDEPASPPSADAAVTGPLRILLSETEEDQPLLRILQQDAAGTAASAIMLAVGPEGGWTAAEISLFTRSGWHSASLGPRILRVETAVIAALAVVNAAAAQSSLVQIRSPQ
ncbi:MAG TPA: RsmE family RNA methyltransferase [Acidobacteriaceae bacterium]|jgi:16S rRNA (uracil1498-N3)-methyltransferase